LFSNLFRFATDFDVVTPCYYLWQARWQHVDRISSAAFIANEKLRMVRTMADRARQADRQGFGARP